MRRIISFAILVLLSLCPVCHLYSQDKMIAVVNNEIITQKDLYDFLNFIRMQYSRELSGKDLEEKVNSVKQDLLQRLIEDKIMLQQAKNEKISIEPTRIKAKINEIKKRYALESDFERDLAKQGLVQADLENKIREQMLTFSIVEHKVRSKIMVRPEEITDFYNQNKRKFLKSEERLLTVIVLQDEGAAKSMSYYLRLGDKLEDLAGRYTFTVDKLSAYQGQDLRREIEEVVFRLGITEVSDPVEIGGQYYIFRLNDILGSQQLSLAQAQEQIQVYLFDKKVQEELTKWLDGLKKESYIKILDN
ncbi:MAG: peptidyl-prolyl cis-trans isomerase [Candidatus Omnitrophica bacterium]|nr:peptidyl-prolyl cis-trans isomerase [Candidatus Omnitrophota bacterium]MBU1923778.1 peptidyl-prolyl cis-trans isomerase [Candidatus Omnitrophota bacterium]